MRSTFIAVALAASAQALTLENDLAITAGVIYGITQGEHLEELSGCMRDSETFVTEIIHGTEMIIEWDLRSVISGTRAIARAVRHLPEYLNTCEDSTGDLKAFEEWLKIFIEPVNLVQTIAGNALHHMKRVSIDVIKAKRDLANEEYFSFGDQIGQLLALLTMPLTPEEIQALINDHF